jgi:spore maturation protein CgeB
MKALVVGPKIPDFDPGYNRAIADAFRQCGYQVRCLEFFVTTPPGLTNRIKIDLACTFGLRRFYNDYVNTFNDALLSTSRDFLPDLVIVVRGSKIFARTLQKISAAKILWCHDLIRRCELSTEQLESYDKIYAFDRSDVAWLAKQHLVGHFLPLGFDPKVYRIYPLKKDIDVFFVGAYYPDRRYILEFLADNLPHRVLRFYGRHTRYREPKTWARYIYYVVRNQRAIFVNRNLNADEIGQFYARSKICINLHHEQSMDGCNPRVFEVMAAGSFQLCDDLEYIRNNFGQYLQTYKDQAELKDLILKFLADDRNREERAKAAQSFAFQNHTFLHRVSQILFDLDKPTISPGNISH